MSDARLRELERQAATGDEDARARLLLERARLGHFTRERLALAAHAGDPTSRRSLDLPAQDGLDLLVWARGFYAFGQHACVRLVAAAVRGPLDRRRPTADLAPLEALRPWLVCPCAEHAAPVVRLARLTPQEPSNLPGLVLGLEWAQGPAAVLRWHAMRDDAERARPPLDAAAAATGVAQVAAGGFALHLRECFPVRHRIALLKEVRAASGFGLQDAIIALEGVNAVPRAITDLTAAVGADAAREVVGRALIDWALDPASRCVLPLPGGGERDALLARQVVQLLLGRVGERRRVAAVEEGPRPDATVVAPRLDALLVTDVVADHPDGLLVRLDRHGNLPRGRNSRRTGRFTLQPLHSVTCLTRT
jgi:hypothetical protein